jgi:hypothetical protein
VYTSLTKLNVPPTQCGEGATAWHLKPSETLIHAQLRALPLPQP